MTRCPADPPALDTTAARKPGPFESRRARGRGVRADVVAMVFAGGCAGGALRYAVSSVSHPSAGVFPWATLAVNLVGAFVLTVVVVVAADLVRSRYVRPLLGTGFCGALTTFSSVVVAADQLFAHGHPRTAVVYLAATAGGGLAAAALGLVSARAAVTGQRRSRGRSRT